MDIDWDALPQAEALALLQSGLDWRSGFIKKLMALDAPKAGRPNKGRNGFGAPLGDLDVEQAGEA